ncbi:hypothetical protein Golob_026329, partial [Gossypium lobatum]|nr:hypothetical protein [Gossypium lobatum]
MHKGKSILEFYTRLCEISNEAFYLGERVFELKQVYKVLKLLPEQFAIKVTITNEAKEITSLRLDKLIGSLQTFELNLEEAKCDNIKHEKNIAFN